MIVRLSSAAITDSNTAFNWYEDERDGLGEELAQELEHALSLIREHPEVGGVAWGQYRRAVRRWFPYSVIYQVSERDAVVVAVFHASRDPEIWKSRPDA